MGWEEDEPVEHVCTDECPSWHRDIMSRDGKVAMLPMPKESHLIGLDEVLSGDDSEQGCGFHIERLDDNTFWMRVHRENFHFYVRSGKLVLTHGWTNPE